MVALIGYASARGSTREIAERIHSRLALRGVRAELVSLDQVPGAVHYDAFILGSAIHNQAWLPSATEFVDLNVDHLAKRPTWLFSVGIPAALGRAFQNAAMREGPKAIARFKATVKPRGHQLFSGVVREADMSTLGRIVFRATGGRFGDFRDWAAIDAFADAIAAEVVAEGLVAPSLRLVPVASEKKPSDAAVASA